MYMVDFLAIKKTDILLVSYPKTGNTWVRFFFMNLYNQKEHIFEEIGFKELDAYFHEIGHGKLRESFIFNGQPRILKTHNKPRPVLGGLSNKVIYILRDPRDTMVSFYNYRINKDTLPTNMDFAKFIRDPKIGLRSYFEHFKAWETKIDFLIIYESLKKDEETVFLKIVSDIFGQEYSEEQVLKAVYHASFDQIRKSEKEKGHSKAIYAKKGTSFTRSGRSKQWQEYFSEIELSFYDQLKGEYKFNYY